MPRTRQLLDRERDIRAETRARGLLREAAGDDVADAYEELGFVAVEKDGNGYGYLVYPHRPVVAYDAESRELLNEYCVRFPDRLMTDAGAGEWLPDADDVLAKWIALKADERRIIGAANMDVPGRQLDPAMVRRDLDTLTEWEGARA